MQKVLVSEGVIGPRELDLIFEEELAYRYGYSPSQMDKEEPRILKKYYEIGNLKEKHGYRNSKVL